MARLPDEGDTVGPWRILHFIGEGRSGSVFKVRETTDSRRIGALKIFCGTSLQATETAFKAETDFVERQRIPGFMPAFYDRDHWNDVPFFVMEYATALPEKLSIQQARRLVGQTADALLHLHLAGFLHCDVKPKNLGLVDNRVVLLDFGSIRTIEDARRFPARVGTWTFMAPEVREALQLDVRSDVYSLGATLKLLCDGTARRTFDTLVLKALSNNPEERPQSMLDFRRELHSAQDRLARFNAAVKWAAIVMIAALLFTGGSYLYRRADILKRTERRRETQKRIAQGLTCYQTCDFINAYLNLHVGMESEEFHPEDYKGVDVKGLHDDSRRRMQEAERWDE